jgi:glycine hydroxymethyltransferase
MQGGPLGHIIAAKAVAFAEALKPSFRDYQKMVRANARALAEALKAGGLRLVSGGTDNHMVLIDLTPFDITGRQAEEALVKVNIVANRNAIPYDTKPPRVASGMRLGTPAVTTRGMTAAEMTRIAQLIIRVLTEMNDPATEREVRDEVMELASRFPVPGIDV